MEQIAIERLGTWVHSASDVSVLSVRSLCALCASIVTLAHICIMNSAPWRRELLAELVFGFAEI